MSILIPLDFTQLLLAQTNSCHTVGPLDLIAILALLGGLLTFASTAGLPTVTIASIGTAAAKVMAILGISASLGSIIVPFQGLLDIAAVAAVVEGIKHILGCG
ncbi:hypothetical protein QUA40_23655 [Microcoleus sp. Pol11C3]|uniref:hypothetical protein n=1 Tax=Microcoleus sp. Pol11C3 TaxID=3055390 RepID=UPI002FD70330